MAASRPVVHVIATGGSISGLGPHRLDYTLYPELGRRLSVEEMLARIPEAAQVAEVKAENLLRVGSSSIGPAEWLQLAQRIDAFRAARSRRKGW
jgi:L-asparaginase